MMKKILFSLVITLCFSTISTAQQDTFSVTDGYECTETLDYTNEVTFSEKGKYRIITSNAIPNHTVGAFPNPGNPNAIRPQEKTYKISLHPQKTGKLISVYSDGFGQGFPAYEFGVAINGIKLEPSAAEFFQKASGGMNLAWNIEALSTATDLGDDCNNAHVQPTGEYHYHGTPWGIVEKVEGKSMFLTGWAADGFPIYYKYGYEDANNPESKIVTLTSSYTLLEGKRLGDGKNTPDGIHDGTYVRDYFYEEGLGDLDEANGRFGVTPEFPEGTYYYVITDEFPSLPRFFVGTPSEDFKVRLPRGNGDFPPREGRREGQRGSQQGEHPNFNQLLEMMDANNDGMLSKREVKGPLQRHFSEIDSNDDGYLTEKEFRNAPKPSGRPSRMRRRQ